MGPPWKLHQLEGAMQPPRFDRRDNEPTWNPPETPWNPHQSSVEPARKLHQRRRYTSTRGKYTCPTLVYKGTTWKTLRRFNTNRSQVHWVNWWQIKYCYSICAFWCRFQQIIGLCWCSFLFLHPKFYLSGMFVAWWFWFLARPGFQVWTLQCVVSM